MAKMATIATGGRESLNVQPHSFRPEVMEIRTNGLDDGRVVEIDRARFPKTFALLVRMYEAMLEEGESD